MTAPVEAGDQDAVVAFLADPASYGLRGGVERVETHCSIVFLAGDRAYKLKRAIRYAALDYTTRDLRRTACEAELRLNRRTAPELYLAVQPVTREPNGSLAFNGVGPAIDHVVVMRRFAQSELFEQMAATGRLTPPLMRQLGATVARFHLAAEVTPAFGGCGALRRDIAGNDRELAKVAADLNGAAIGKLSSGSRTMLDALASLLDRRRAEGKVRRCHGDLRLANICLHAGRLTLFDCIEFSDAVSCIDVLHDLAFLLMDLQVHGRGDLANVVFNAYLDVAPETEGIRGLPLFLALRAATRSYALAGSAHRQANPRQAERRRVLARQHIQAGLGFLAPQPPRLVAIGGDDHRRRHLSAILAGLIPPVPGARILHPAPAGRIDWTQASSLIAAGCSVVIDGAFAAAADRIAVQAFASTLQRPCTALWFGTPPQGLDHQLWQVFDPGEGVLAAVARAAPGFNATPARPLALATDET